MSSALWYTSNKMEGTEFEDYENAIDLNVKNDEPLLDRHSSWRGSKKAWLKVSSKFLFNRTFKKYFLKSLHHYANTSISIGFVKIWKNVFVKRKVVNLFSQNLKFKIQ